MRVATLLGLLLVGMPEILAAQARDQFLPHPSSLFVIGLERPASPFELEGDDRPEPAGSIPPTYWQEGALVGGLIVGILGAGLGHGLCGYANSETNCIPALITGGLIGATLGGTIGALIGGQFSK